MQVRHKTRRLLLSVYMWKYIAVYAWSLSECRTLAFCSAGGKAADGGLQTAPTSSLAPFRSTAGKMKPAGKKKKQQHQQPPAPEGQEDPAQAAAAARGGDGASTSGAVAAFPGVRILEGLSATGLRSIRYANELVGPPSPAACLLLPTGCRCRFASPLGAGAGS